ncbi:MAG: cytochrome c oxidase subunit 3 family protein [Candidatus Thioglobus sp.]|nr:cytochrome c oxidase subunit 3 family protein [Candidatus Thioglobus pontius]MBL6977259.1 cytochrome c oxidase subunit 3 family protein [Candidatus Thioglobus sp.]MBL6984161.1 cytochrome c oxidase subunit 3 family protein [Candidatus Thioglobus sp.]
MKMNKLTKVIKYPPGDLAIWIFIMAELLVFGLFFATYAVTRIDNIELFEQYQQTLDTTAALWNTLALISSSYFVIRSVLAVNANQQPQAYRFMLLAMLAGLVFVVIKTNEFAVHMDHGITLSTNTFYMFYLSLAFFHYLHVILGMIVLLVLARNLKRGQYTVTDSSGLESGASYWHMVDLVWLILFPLVYVM